MDIGAVILHGSIGGLVGVLVTDVQDLIAAVREDVETLVPDIATSLNETGLTDDADDDDGDWW